MSALHRTRCASCKNDLPRFRADFSDNPPSSIPHFSVSVCYQGSQSFFLSPNLFFWLKFSIIFLVSFSQFTCLSALFRPPFSQIIVENFPLSTHCPGAAGTVLYYQHKREMFSILLFKEMEFGAARIGREALVHPYTPDCKVHSFGGIVKRFIWQN